MLLTWGPGAGRGLEVQREMHCELPAWCLYSCNWLLAELWALGPSRTGSWVTAGLIVPLSWYNHFVLYSTFQSQWHCFLRPRKATSSRVMTNKDGASFRFLQPDAWAWSLGLCILVDYTMEQLKARRKCEWVKGLHQTIMTGTLGTNSRSPQLVA